MTKIQIYKIECECGNTIDVELFHSVNITVDPELLVKLKNRKINNYECKKCGQKNELAYQFLFVDMKRNIWVWCYPEAARGNVEEIKKELGQSKANDLLVGLGASKPSLVFGYDELFDLIK